VSIHSQSAFSCKVLCDANEEIIFSCQSDETILEGAEREGWLLPYSCLKGVCMTCEGTLLNGQVAVRGGKIVSGHNDKVRFCVSRPVSDVEIRPSSIIRMVEKPVRRIMNAHVYQILQPDINTYVVDLRLPIGVRTKFQAGQYLKVYLDDGSTRSYSMANPPHKNQEIQLHIRYLQGGEFSEHLKKNVKKGSLLKVEMPYGNFTLDNPSCNPVILVATGTGFAPMKSIIEDMIFKNNTDPVTLYWGTNTFADMYMMSLVEGWAVRYPWFTFVPVISQPDENWKGRTGFVHHAVLADHPNLAEYGIYACGNINMITAAKKDFINSAKLIPDNFHCDIFVPTGG